MSLRSDSDPNYAKPLTRLIDRVAGPLDMRAMTKDERRKLAKKAR